VARRQAPRAREACLSAFCPWDGIDVMHVTITVLRASVFRAYPYRGTVKNQGLHIQKYPQVKRAESCRP